MKDERGKGKGTQAEQRLRDRGKSQSEQSVIAKAVSGVMSIDTIVGLGRS